MNNHQIMRMLQMALRGRRGKSQRIALLLVAVVVGYTFLQPVIAERFGVHLPSLVGNQSSSSSSEAGGTANTYPNAGGKSATQTPIDASTKKAPSSKNATGHGERAILEAFANRRSDLIVEVDVRVRKLLADDNVGSRHQKMILELPSGHTVLLAHNIDLAQRVPAQEGDTIRVKGEYEYSEQGGVLHWTHHDPRKRHEDGWIEHNGQRFE